jgi:hypothetical protein
MDQKLMLLGLQFPDLAESDVCAALEGEGGSLEAATVLLEFYEREVRFSKNPLGNVVCQADTMGIISKEKECPRRRAAAGTPVVHIPVALTGTDDPATSPSAPPVLARQVALCAYRQRMYSASPYK